MLHRLEDNLSTLAIQSLTTHLLNFLSLLKDTDQISRSFLHKILSCFVDQQLTNEEKEGYYGEIIEICVMRGFLIKIDNDYIINQRNDLTLLNSEEKKILSHYAMQIYIQLHEEIDNGAINVIDFWIAHSIGPCTDIYQSIHVYKSLCSHLIAAHEFAFALQYAENLVVIVINSRVDDRIIAVSINNLIAVWDIVLIKHGPGYSYIKAQALHEHEPFFSVITSGDIQAMPCNLYEIDLNAFQMLLERYNTLHDEYLALKEIQNNQCIAIVYKQFAQAMHQSLLTLAHEGDTNSLKNVLVFLKILQEGNVLAITDFAARHGLKVGNILGYIFLIDQSLYEIIDRIDDTHGVVSLHWPEMSEFQSMINHAVSDWLLEVRHVFQYISRINTALITELIVDYLGITCETGQFSLSILRHVLKTQGIVPEDGVAAELQDVLLQIEDIALLEAVLTLYEDATNDELEIALAIINAWGEGQQEGLRKLIEDSQALNVMQRYLQSHKLNLEVDIEEENTAFYIMQHLFYSVLDGFGYNYDELSAPFQIEMESMVWQLLMQWIDESQQIALPYRGGPPPGPHGNDGGGSGVIFENDGENHTHYVHIVMNSTIFS